MDKADILKEKSWQKDYVRAVNNIDNLNYIYEKDKSGSNIFNKEYFLNSWTRSLAAYVEKEIPFEETLKLFKEKRIKDIAEPLTNDQIIGKIGDIPVKIKVGKDYQEMSLRKAIPFKRKEVINSLNNAEEILKYNYKHNLLTESKDFGNVLYQNYQSKRVYPNGREVANKIDNNLAFKVLKAMGGDTFISYNQKYNYYYINSDFADLQLLAEVINEKYKGSANEVRGRFIFGKISEGMTEESFNNILKDFKNMAKVLNIRDEKVDQERLSEKKELSKEEVEKLKKEKGRKSK